MGMIIDNFTGGKSAIWEVIVDDPIINVLELNDQIETDYDVRFAFQSSFLSTINTYSLIAPSYIECTLTKRSVTSMEFWLYISLDKPYVSLTDFVRVGFANGNYFIQQKVGGGSLTTIAMSASAGLIPQTYKMDLPAIGDPIRLYEGGIEVASAPTYPLSSRDCYVMIGVNYGGSASFRQADYDSFSMQYFGNDAIVPVKVVSGIKKREVAASMSRRPVVSKVNKRNIDEGIS